MQLAINYPLYKLIAYCYPIIDAIVETLIKWNLSQNLTIVDR